MDQNFFSFSANTPSGDTLDMGQYKGKVVLVVNTATKCGLTPQFVGLEEIHQTYKGKGLVVIGFPCNQFGGQEPLENSEMESTCQLNYGVSFQLTKKIEVNGSHAHPIYTYLTNAIEGESGKDIEWNFAKFLINQSGGPVKRFSPSTEPDQLKADIEQLLR